MKSKYRRFYFSNKERVMFCRFNLFFMLIFVVLLPTFNNFLSAQETIIKEAAKIFMNSGELMVFSEEYDKNTFEKMSKRTLNDSTKTYLQSVIDQNPNSATAYHNMGIAYLLNKNYPKASKNLKIALEKDACLVNAGIGLAIIYALSENPQKGIKYLDGVMNCGYRTSDLYYWKGMILIAKEKFKHSLIELNRAVKAQPQNYLYVFSRGYVFLNLGADRKAIEDFAYSYELNPLESKNYQGSYLFKKHQIRCGFMLAYFKKHQEELSWNIRELLEVGIGNLFKRINYRSSWDKFRQALKLYEKGHPLIYYLMAMSASKRKDKLYYYDKALKLDNDIYDVYRNRGLLYLTLGDGQRALADFEELIRLKPNLYVSYREKSKVLLLQGNWEEVVSTCNKALQLDKNDNEVFLNRGKALSMMKQHQKAIEDYDHILQRTSENIPVLFEKGKAYLALGQYKEALIACDSILNISSNWPKAHNLRGVVYMNSQKLGAALASFDQSILLAPHYREAYFNRSLTNFRLKNFIAALRDINKSLKMNEKDPEAYYLRAVIKKELGQKNACKDVQKALEMGMYLEKKEVDRICE